MEFIKTASIGAILSLAVAMPNAYAVKNGQKFKDWEGMCEKMGKQEVCGVTQTVFNADKNPMLQLLVHKEKGQKAPIMSIMVPHGTEIRAGVGISIDKKKVIGVPYVLCNPSGCRAIFPINDELLGELKKGHKMQIYTYLFGAEKPTMREASLSGFTNALNAL